MEKEQNRKEATPLQPLSQGLRRSTGLGDVPPPSPPAGEGGSHRASERKRPRLQKEEEGKGHRVEVKAEDADDVSVQLSPQKVDTSLASGDGAEVEYSEDEGRGQRSLCRRQPPTAQSKAGGTISDLDEASLPSTGVRTRSAAAAAGGSEVKLSGTSAEEEQEAHPCLFIENILDVVFKHVINPPGPRTVIATDAQNIRLVCKTWKTSVTRLYRQTRPATVFLSYDQRGNPNSRGRLGLYSLTKFMKTMKPSSMVPVQKYKFGAAVFRRKNLKMLKEFLRLCGPDTVELSMSIMTSDTENVMLNLNPENLPSLELNKLKALDFDMHEDQQGQDKLDDPEFVKLLELLLIAAKMLQELKMAYRSYAYFEPQLSQRDLAVQQLSLVIGKRLAKTVKKLELSVEMNEIAFNNLAEMEAKLESFELRQGSVFESRAMYKFLQSQATSLKYLQFWSSYDYTKLIVEFPRLDELVRLQLPDSTVSLTAPSQFTESFPKLHSLEISSENAVSTLLSTVKTPSGSLKVLDLTNHRFMCPPSLIKKVAQSFPYLAELRIRVVQEHKETMGEVFKYLDSLESLHIAFVNLNINQDVNWVDSLFSGIREADCRRIGRLPDFETVNANDLRTQPSIVNLKNLRKLDIQGRHVHHSIDFGFSDVSAHFVFLKMDNLREIKLANLARQFSPRYLELLRDKLVLRGPN